MYRMVVGIAGCSWFLVWSMEYGVYARKMPKYQSLSYGPKSASFLLVALAYSRQTRRANGDDHPGNFDWSNASS